MRWSTVTATVGVVIFVVAASGCSESGGKSGKTSSPGDASPGVVAVLDTVLAHAEALLRIVEENQGQCATLVRSLAGYAEQHRVALAELEARRVELEQRISAADGQALAAAATVRLPPLAARAMVAGLRTALNCPGEYEQIATSVAVLDRTPGFRLDVEKSADRTQFGRACAAGDEFACYKAGNLFLAGKGGPRDLGRARELFAVGCQSLGSYGCFELALMRLGGDGGPAEPARAREYFTTECDLKLNPYSWLSSIACGVAGIMASAGTGGKTDAALAKRSFAQGCLGEWPGKNLGYEPSCVAFALQLLGGAEATDGSTRARLLLDRACNDGFGSPLACLALGRPQGLVVSVPPSRVMTRENLAPACDAGAAQRCLELARLWNAGIGGQRDEAKAVALREQA